MKKNTKRYIKPKIKSSKVSPISFYARDAVRSALDSEYLLAYRICN